MEFPVWLILVAAVWAALVALSIAGRVMALREGEPLTGLARLGLILYAAALHGMRVHGRENLPKERRPGPLIIVANHTAGVDPLLVQAACPFEIRWLMASDMRLASLDQLWDWGRVIFLDRRAGSGAGMRAAAGALRDGDVIGIFPEGGIARPPRSVLPFRAGVGVLIRRSKARVLPVVVDGAPIVATARASLYTPSAARLRFMPMIDYSRTKQSSEEIAADLHRRFVEWTGWPESEQPPLPG